MDGFAPMHLHGKSWCLALIVLGCMLPSRVRAEEESQRFLDELRQRGYYDVALQYLEWARTSPLVADDFKNAATYEEAVTLVRQATTQADGKQAEQLLQTARAKFDEYVKAHPNTDRIDSIKVHSGNIDIERAGQRLKRLDQSGTNKRALQAEARALYEEAQKSIGAAEGSIRGQLDQLPRLIPPSDTAAVQRRDRLRKDLASARLSQCLIEYQLAKTYDAGSSLARQQLKKAAAEYQKLYEGSSRGGPPYARLMQGRCLQEMGDHKRAIDCFDDLTTIDESQLKHRPVFLLFAEAWRWKMESLIALKKYDEAQAPLLIKLGPNETRQPAWLPIRYLAAKALKLKADALKDNSAERNALTVSAVKLAEPVAATRGEFQLAARALLENLGHTVELQESGSFADAVSRGNQALKQGKSVKDALDAAGPEGKKSLATELAAKREDAIAHYRRALALAGPDATDRQRGQVLYYLGLLYFDAQDHLATATLCEHMARNYPHVQQASAAARLAMKAWVAEYGASQGNRQFETDRIRAIADYTAQQWPETDDAAEAHFLLLTFAIQNEEIDAALGHMEKIPATSPRRGEAEVRLGVNQWRVYLNELRKPDATRLPQQKLDGMRDRVEKVLTAGVGRMQSGQKIDGTLVGAVLSLAQLYIDTNRPQQALKWLNDPKVGSLTLIKSGNEHTRSKAFQTEAYKVALRSHIGSLTQYRSNLAALDKATADAEEMMNRLEQSVGNDRQAAERLTQIYIIMGRDLEAQLLGVRQDVKARAALSESFEQFLQRIAQRPGNSYGSLVWVAETFFNLGSAADTGQRPIEPAAKAYFGKAAATYKQILAQDAAQPGFVPNGAVKASVQMRLATCHRRLGEFDSGMTVLTAILKAQPQNALAQKEAAQLLEDRGHIDPNYYEKAVVGDQTDPDSGEKVVWGWSKLANRAATSPALSDLYFDSTLHSYQCRYLLGMKVGPPRQAVLLEAAKMGIKMLYARHTTLGGANVKGQYDSLLKSIQRELKEPVVGLTAFDSPMAETVSAAK